LDSNRETVFSSVRSLPRYDKQDSWSNEFVVGQTSTEKKVSTEVEEFVGIRHQATTGGNTAD
jgi:hypothetical protein